MKIIGFNIHKLSAERKNAIKGKLAVKSKLDILDIKSESLNISKEPALKFDFLYAISYDPNVAKIEVSGSILAIDDKNESKDILKDWKDKKFNSPVKIHIFNFIMNKCNLKALELEEEIGLPLHIPFPKFKQKSGSSANYTG